MVFCNIKFDARFCGFFYFSLKIAKKLFTIKEIMMKKSILALLALSSILAAADNETIVELEKTTITAQKFETNVRETTKNVTVIEQEEIEKSGAKSVTDLLKTVPGINVGAGFGSGTIDFRGQGEASKNNVLVLVNGISINTIDMSGPDLSIIDVSNIERIEVIPSGGVVYGDKAVGGVINIITKAQGNSVKLETGSYGYETFGTNINEKIGDFAVHTDFSRTLKDGYRNNSNFSKDNFSFGLGYDINENNKIKLDYAYNESDMNYAGALTEEELNAGRTQAFTTDWLTYTRIANTEVTLNKKNNYSLTYDFEKGNLSVQNIINYYGKTSNTIYSDKSTYNIKSTLLSDNLKFKYNYKNNSLITGIDISEGTSETNGANKITKNQLGLFALNTYKFTEDLSFNMGFRNENVELSYSSGKEKTYNENLFSMGTNYVYSDTGSVYASFEQNYRTPTTDEYFTYGVFLENLEPQKTNAVEIGIREYLGNTYVTGTLFNSITDGEIYYNPITSKNENIPGDTERKGIEISTKTYLGDFTISQAYTYIDAKMKEGVYTGKTIPWVPKNKYSIKTDYNFNSITLGAEYIYTDSLYAVSDLYNAADKIEGYSLVNLNSSYNYKNINIYGGVNNLFDKKYNEYVVNYGYGHNYYPAEERNYFVGVLYEF